MELLYSDDPFSVFLFIVVLIVLFIVLLNLIMGIISSFGTSSQVYLLKGISNGNTPLLITVDPNKGSSVPIERSNNKTGIEFSWSVWLNINDLPSTTTAYQHVFSKGEGTQVTTEFSENKVGMVNPNNAPGLYIKKSASGECNLVVVMNTFFSGDEDTTYRDVVEVNNVPMNKWINVIIRVMNTSLDVYLNGLIVKSHELSGVPRQNYGDVNIALGTGFSGYISNLVYYSYGLSPGKIQSISSSGANLKMASNVNVLKKAPPYLSTRWYSDNINV